MFKITNVTHVDDGDDRIYVLMTLGNALWSAVLFVGIGVVLARVLG